MLRTSGVNLVSGLSEVCFDRTVASMNPPVLSAAFPPKMMQHCRSIGASGSGAIAIFIALQTAADVLLSASSSQNSRQSTALSLHSPVRRRGADADADRDEAEREGGTPDRK
jgi:hypothetical protein